MGRRLNIGLFIDDQDIEFTNSACRGAELGAIELDANLFIFPGRYLDSVNNKENEKEYEYQYNSVFNFVNVNSIDILYVLMGSIGCRTDKHLQKEFLNGLPNIPIVTLFTKLSGFQSVTFDNTSGFKEEIKHLIHDHNVKKMGFVSGPFTNSDAMERYEAFVSIVEEEGIQIGEKIIVYGDFTDNSAKQVKELLDNNPDLEAIVFANDNMALGSYDELKRRGLIPGQNIRIVGYDDVSKASFVIPSLTTVEASSEELTYNAVLNAETFLETGKISQLKIDTHFIKRESCGCGLYDVEALKSRLKMDDEIIDDTLKNKDEIVFHIRKYIFGIEIGGNEYEKEQFYKVFGYFVDLLEYLKKGDITLEKYHSFVDDSRIIDRMYKLLNTKLLYNVKNDKIFNVFLLFQKLYEKYVEDYIVKYEISSLFSKIYILISSGSLDEFEVKTNNIAKISQLVNMKIGDMFLTTIENRIPYNEILDQLDRIGFGNTYLYTFNGVMKNKKGSNTKMPRDLYLKAFSNGGYTQIPEKGREKISADNILNNDFIPTDRRMTMILSPLFVGEDLFGFLLNEITSKDLGNVAPVTYQLAATLKSFIMIENQNNIKQKLEEMLERFKEDNSKLNEISYTDVLTNVYNRRGFLVNSQKAVNDPENAGKNAIIAYVDMDNLKMINDVYGHDEGDFALKETAEILKDAFRSSDVIGRFGGDEFVAFAMVGVDNYEERIKERIDIITKKHNDIVKKPYYIEMSTGVCEFVINVNLDIYEILDKADEKLYEEKREKKKKRGSYR